MKRRSLCLPEMLFGKIRSLTLSQPTCVLLCLRVLPARASRSTGYCSRFCHLIHLEISIYHRLTPIQDGLRAQDPSRCGRRVDATESCTPPVSVPWLQKDPFIKMLYAADHRLHEAKLRSQRDAKSPDKNTRA